jgi:hypothetical protein
VDFEVIKEISASRAGAVLSIDCADGFFFVSSVDGRLRKFHIGDRSLNHDFGRIHEYRIESIACNEKWIFTSDVGGVVKKFCVDSNALVEDYG